MEYEKKIAKPHYNAVIQRYDSKPNKPKVIKKDTLNRLADPIKYRYNGDSNVKSSAENIDAENVNLNISSQGPVMVKRGNDGALAISIDTEAIKRNAGAQSGPIKIQLPAQHGAVHEGTFLTGGNETPVHEASSKVLNRLQEARRLDGNYEQQKRVGHQDRSNSRAPRDRSSERSNARSIARSSSRTKTRDVKNAVGMRQSARVETKPRIPKPSSFKSARETQQEASGEPKRVVTYDSMGHVLINGKPRGGASRRGAGARKGANAGGPAAGQPKKPASTFLTGAEDSDTSVEGRPRRKYLKRGAGNAISIKPTGRLPRVKSVRKVIDPRVFAGIPAKPKRTGAKAATPIAGGPGPVPTASRVKSTSSISRVSLQRVDRDQSLQKSQSAQAIARGRRDDDSSVDSHHSYSGKNVRYPQARGAIAANRENSSGDQDNSRRNSHDNSSYRGDSRSSRGGDSRGRPNPRSDNRDRNKSIRGGRDDSRGRNEPRNDSRDRGRYNSHRGDRDGSRGRNEPRNGSRDGNKSQSSNHPSEEKKQQNAFYEQITAKKKEELLNYLRGEMDEVNSNGSVTVLPPLQALRASHNQDDAPEDHTGASISNTLQKLQHRTAHQGKNGEEEGMLALLASHAKKLSDKIDRVDQKLEDYSRLKVPMVTTNRAAVSPLTTHHSRRVSPEKQLPPISPERQLLQTWAQYEEEELALTKKIEDVKKLKQQIRESEMQSTETEAASPDKDRMLAGMQLMNEYDEEESTLGQKIADIKALKRGIESPMKRSEALGSPDKASLKILGEYDTEEATLTKKIEDIKRLKRAIDGPENLRQGGMSPDKASLKLWQKYDQEEEAVAQKIDAIRKLRSGVKNSLNHRNLLKVDLKIWNHADDEEAMLTRKINEINAKKEAEEALKAMLRSHEKPTVARAPDAPPDAAPLHLQLGAGAMESRSLEEQTEAEHFASLINRNLHRPKHLVEDDQTGNSSVDNIESILATLDMQQEISNQVKKSKIGGIVDILQGAENRHNKSITNQHESPLKQAVKLSIAAAGASTPLSKSNLRKVSPITVPADADNEIGARARRVAAMNERHQTPPAIDHESEIVYDPLATDEVTYQIDNGSPDKFK